MMSKDIRTVQPGDSVSILGFLIEVLSKDKSIRKDIDRLYKRNKYEFYKHGKEHKLYNHPIITNGGLLQEEYSKRLLGILAVLSEPTENDYTEEVLELLEIIKKRYTYTYTYVMNKSRIQLGNFINDFLKKYKGTLDNKGIPIEDHVIILLFLIGGGSDNKLVYDNCYNQYAKNLITRWGHFTNQWNLRATLNTISHDEKKQIRKLKRRIYKEFGEIKNFEDILMGNFENEYMDATAFLFDLEDLESVSIFDNIKFKSKDIDEILYLYISDKKDLNDIKKATEFLISMIYTKYLMKAYKEVKNEYFKNNKETMFVELEGLGKQSKSLEIALVDKEQSLAEADKEIKRLQMENNRLRIELEEENKNRAELNGLREFVFNIDKRIEPNEFKIDTNLLKDYEGIIVGGHEKWQQKMKESLPNFTFIHVNNMNFDTRILKDIEVLFIYTNYLNHGMYYKVMEAITGKGIKVVYLNQQNKELVLENIHSEIRSLKQAK